MSEIGWGDSWHIFSVLGGGCAISVVGSAGARRIFTTSVVADHFSLGVGRSGLVGVVCPLTAQTEAQGDKNNTTDSKRGSSGMSQNTTPFAIHRTQGEPEVGSVKGRIRVMNDPKVVTHELRILVDCAV